MQKFANLLENLYTADAKDKIIKREGEEMIKVSIMTSAIAFMYEKIRTIVDYSEDHLLRKNAIFRILKRRFLEGGDYYKMAENILKELISAKYLENNKMPESKIVDIAKVIEKYDLLYTGVENHHGLRDALSLYDWILSLAACELEEAITPANKMKVFARFMHDEIKDRIEIVSERMTEEEKNLQIFLAVNRSLIKSDRPMLEYLIIKLWHADWKNDYQLFLQQFIERIFEIKQSINGQINHKLSNKLLQYCRRYAMMIIIFRDVIYQDFKNARLLLDNPKLLETKIREVCQEKYDETRKRLKTHIGRAIIYVFLTKMLLALIVEIPFDMYILNTFSWMAAIINITFPPLLMVFIATTIRTPGEKNTQTMVKGIFDLLEGNLGEIQYIRDTKKRNWFVWLLLNSIYFITFLVPFALIIYFLYRIEFSILSIMLFLVFFSIVSFFGVRIRNSARELNVLKKRENIFGEIFDFFTLPFIRMGRFLSLNFSKINIFVFILDFLIEAPLKIILQGFEEWLAFFKEKKEDLE
ncbi:MAG: hypothetical protein A2Y82_01675 [Candidatus Buchananbacteria bacterium RBG_13_36_9]|uniref:Uncharacterized protein n=1 Tax=Candidatus Buchananbacteria bacterium RBG_13_36_9 TaxID=1797530 RepID=A0A1G1XM97_9BACT|nr:MAG: hypothetical protein A2Y82_01675 [Candidatus Buchananbacteria bacterium RBG_13_36_9]